MGTDTVAWESSRAAFAEAAAWFLDVAEHVGDRWDRPALGEWDVRALVGHTSRSLLTVEEYLRVPADRADVVSSADYYRATRAMSVGPAVARRGRDAGHALGDDPVRSVAVIAARVLPLLDETDGTELVTTLAGGIRLADYLPTRTFELVVHTLDLGAALGLSVEPPAGPAALVVRLLGELAVEQGRVGPLVLAATGRAHLPEGFTLL
ncbi:maleylpyruvate isomerase N-terminal domain-containing protein [Cellulomonas carbonis]|uniref:Mycothiol-dependent maleylpyruvate isomerase metal-binding domain-containing protein n=1 Tax=Cellulomonas carbonis T26 TaxID=947969 RepID=A0A0A0BUU0_9CELL|nr:maleylpyruvate isomerase N-terminal domain-containing protein [Cellulomonas carbonis]KGM11676.1 hypothetical protein N868_07885 [Cellulomonas carbonis T26]GGB99120.1 hypothetical protein GCM10010972_09930 [Cellulomonas carbonis]